MRCLILYVYQSARQVSDEGPHVYVNCVGRRRSPRTSRRIDISVLVLGPLPRSHVMLSLWRFPWPTTYVIEQYIFWQYVADELAALTVADRISFNGSFPMTITKTNLYSLTPLNPTCLQYNWGLQGYALVFLFLFKNIDCAQLAFYVNLHRAVTGPSATLTGRWPPDIDLCRMLTGWVLVRTASPNIEHSLPVTSSGWANKLR